MTKFFVKFFLVVPVLVTFCGCDVKVGGGDSGSGGGGGGSGDVVAAADCTATGDAKTWPYRICYAYTSEVNGNRCTTGKKEFQSLQAYCASLKDDAANNNCAKDKRDAEHALNCKK